MARETREVFFPAHPLDPDTYVGVPGTLLAQLDEWQRVIARRTEDLRVMFDAERWESPWRLESVGLKHEGPLSDQMGTYVIMVRGER